MSRSYVIYIGLLAAFWGASYMFIKVANRDFEPATMMFLRLLIASALLLVVLAAQRGAQASLHDMRSVGWQGFALGVVNGAIPFTLIAWGERHIDSGVAAIANASMPIFVVLIALRWQPSERVRGLRLFGFIVGLVGVGVLAGYAALRSAALNVFTNARMITDKTFAEAKLQELNRLLAGAEAATEKAYGVVKGKVS